MSAPPTSGDSSNEELIRQAEEAIKVEKLLVAARLLKQVQDNGGDDATNSLLTDRQKDIITKAEVIQKQVIDVHLQPAQDGGVWKKQSESHGNRDTIIYYKVEGSKLTCRIETPIESSLLVPLLAVCNESQLYDQWMPKWTFPIKLGVRQSIKLAELEGRGSQIVQVTVDMPFPIANREVVYSTTPVDAIDELGMIAVKGSSIEVGTPINAVTSSSDNDDENQPLKEIPPPEKGIKRIDFDSNFTFRQCPKDHPSLVKSKHRYPEGEKLILVTVTMFTDAHVDYVPLSFINFTTRVAVSGQWGALLQVATDVKEGKRPDHEKCIQEKQQLYGWINQRIDAMCSKMEEETETKKE